MNVMEVLLFLMEDYEGEEEWSRRVEGVEKKSQGSIEVLFVFC
jgi:hypothetical protein